MSARSHPCRSWFLSLVTFALLAAPSFSPANDAIFPASSDAAKKAVDWQNGYFLINGQPTFLTAGEIHYARVPRELWRDRILRTKAMGFNTIQTYVMWNAQEPTEGTFNFEGNLDLDAWLLLCQELGMYTIVRPGPYVCAEWENGGLPAWLCSKPGMRVRTDHPEYLQAVDRYWAKLIPIIAKHQLHKGGRVLMVQLENELPNTWGTDSNAYTRHLYDVARAQGLEIPLFNSGLHHANDPAGNRPFGNRTIPWYSTEFWTGWIGLSGDMSPQMHEEKVRATWKILAFGGAGYDYYVVHGGTNFGYSKGVEVTASYDYSSPIGEAGQLRRVYFPMKRAAMFAQAFSDLLTSSKDGAALIASASAAGNPLQTFVRTGPNGTAIFLADAPRFQNSPAGRGARGRRGGAATAPATPQVLQARITLADGRQIPSGDRTLRLDPGEIRPILTDVFLHQDPKTRIAHPIVLDYAATAILTRKKIGETTYLVCHGASGDSGEIKVKGQDRLLTFKYPDGDVVDEMILPDAPGNPQVRLLVMNTDLADRTWDLGDRLIIGPRYASPEAMDFPTKNSKAIIYSAAGKRELSSPLLDAIDPLPALTNWKTRTAAEPLANTSTWASSVEPKSMEMHGGYPNGWGWYRTTLKQSQAGAVQIRFTGAGDVLRLFLNGQRIDGDRTGATLNLKAGDNELAVLCWNEGRPKMYNFVGPTGLLSARGIWGPVLLIDQKPLASITNWRSAEASATDNAPASPDTDDAAWPAGRGNASRVGFTWLRASFDMPPAALQSGKGAMLLHQGIDDEGEFFLNGQSLAKHVGYNAPGAVDLASALKPGKNILAIRVKNNDGAGGITRPVDIVSLAGKQENWKFQPGVGGLDETGLIATVKNWPQFLAAPWPAPPSPAPAASLPAFHRADFTWRPDPRLHQTLALNTRGLRAGSVWLNGHNLGPYRNTGNNPARMYLPECWLQPTNTLVIFDAEGASPAQASLEPIETFVRAKIP